MWINESAKCAEAPQQQRLAVAVKHDAMDYAVVLEQGSRNWSAYVPDLPGCVAAARTREETERLIQEAIKFHLEGLLIDGIPFPKPTYVEKRAIAAV